MDADQQRAHLLGFAGPAADHHLMAGAALGLDPVPAAARSVGRVELLGDDAFEAHAAGRFQHGVARGLEMLDIAQRLVLALEPVQQLLQPRLALAERQVRADPRRRRTADRRRRRPGPRSCPRTAPPAGRAKSGTPLLVERHRLAVDHAVRQALGLLGDGGEFLRPVQPLAGAQHRLAVLDAQLQAIAVELDLVRPAGAAGRLLDQLGELRLDELGHRRDLAGLGLGGRDRGLLAAVLLVALPHRAGRALLAGHERRRRPPVAGAISSRVRPEATDLGSFRSASSSPSWRASSRCLISSQLVRLPPRRPSRGPISCAPAPSCPAAARLPGRT